MKQLIEVDLDGGTLTLITELVVVSEKKPMDLSSFLTGDDCSLSTSVSTYISLMVMALLISAGNTARRVASRGFWCHLLSSTSYIIMSTPWDMSVC